MRSSITIAGDELQLLQRLKTLLGYSTNAEVVRAALRMLDDDAKNTQLKAEFAAASMSARLACRADMADLDDLCDEGLGP